MCVYITELCKVTCYVNNGQCALTVDSFIPCKYVCTCTSTCMYMYLYSYPLQKLFFYNCEYVGRQRYTLYLMILMLPWQPLLSPRNGCHGNILQAFCTADDAFSAVAPSDTAALK